MRKKFTIAVTDFAIPAPCRGSIDVYSGFSAGQEFGMQIHQEIQREHSTQDASYEAEVYCSHKFSTTRYIFEVAGMVDGIFHQPTLKIEEIKTAFDLNKLHNYLKKYGAQHPYCLQLRTYGYIYWLRKRIMPELSLHLVSARNRKAIDFPIELDIPAYEAWLKIRLKEMADQAESAEKRIKLRQKTATTLSFPFTVARPGQKELIANVASEVKKNNHLLIQAPTGLGKTIGILYPALAESLNRGQKVIYVTPKNSQHLVAAEAAKKLQSKGAKLKSLTLTAKKKICMKEEPLCNAEYCEFAQDHYTKVQENSLIEKLKKKKNLDAKIFKKCAEQYQVCPYEIQMEMVPHVEVVICDYNYVFAPRTGNSRVTKATIAEEQKANLVIDEAHNLPARALDYFSPALSVSVLEKAMQAAKEFPEKFQDRFYNLLNRCITVIKSAATPGKNGPHLIVPAVQEFKDQEILLREFLSAYLESDVVIGPNDPVLNIFNYWSEFTVALDIAISGKSEFFTSYLPNPPQIKITCCDASAMLKDVYAEFAQVVGFSATLKPFDYYSRLSGLQSKKLQTAEYASPFPKTNRKIMIIPQVSSRYSDRMRNYPRIADIISKIAPLRKGNYFAFFPSFDFLERVLSQLNVPAGFEIISQSRGMRHDDVKRLIKHLSNSDKAHIVFAVQGGVLAEGVDYPGEIAIGAFVVGAPLPSYDWEREKMKEYYEQHYAAGADYAYTYPAMAKAIQAAGRVIRSETDKGLIVLMDNRFLQPNYAECMPQDWYDADPREIVSQSILSDISQFWETSQINE